MDITILFTSVGRRVELLHLFHAACRSLGLRGRILATDIDPLAPALSVADDHYIVPRLDDVAFGPQLMEICRREKVDLVLPTIDPDIPVLASLRAELKGIGTQALVVCPEAAAVTADKWKTARFFQKREVKTPQCWLPADLESLSPAFPLFIKPRFGSASKNTFKVRNREELAFFSAYVPDPIVQEFIAGCEITSDVVCDLHGEVIAVVSRQRIEVRSGEVAKSMTVYDPQITETCVRIASGLQAVGPVTVQCIVQDSQPYFTEINARVGGGAPLGVRAGVDWPCWLLAQATGQKLAPPPVGTYQTGLYMTRFDESIFLNEAEREKVASRRL
jgi:carbamoyl-phosphate synthase large subunit